MGYTPYAKAWKNHRKTICGQELEGKVVCGTLSGIASGPVLAEQTYDNVLIDESAQAIDITHTYVPAHARGRGVAHALCNRAFEFARKHHYEVIPTCSYVKDTYLVRIKNEAPSRFEFGK